MMMMTHLVKAVLVAVQIPVRYVDVSASEALLALELMTMMVMMNDGG